jgi:diguanylate cyclase (GGDEF)-like protein
MSLIMVDIDHFKLYNDHYGHQAGDASLAMAARAMRRAAARPQDVVARYGGEEFAILLPQVSAHGAERVALKLLAELEELAIPHATSPTEQRLTVSMGIAACVPAEDSVSADLVQAADALLYEAKAAGRNGYRLKA